MGRPRFYLAPPELAKTRVVLGRDSLDHLRARRVRAGDEISLFDGQGGEALALVGKIDRGGGEAEIIERPGAWPRPRLRVALGIGICRWERLRMAVEKAAELGAAEIRPIVSERSRPLGRGLKAKLERVALEALKQCRRSWAPVIREPQELKLVLGAADDYDHKIILDQEGPRLAGMNQSRPGSILLLIGPEGGFAPAEKKAALDAGWSSASLSEAVLRTETAVLAGLVLALWEK